MKALKNQEADSRTQKIAVFLLWCLFALFMGVFVAVSAYNGTYGDRWDSAIIWYLSSFTVVPLFILLGGNLKEEGRKDSGNVFAITLTVTFIYLWIMSIKGFIISPFMFDLFKITPLELMKNTQNNFEFLYAVVCFLNGFYFGEASK